MKQYYFLLLVSILSIFNLHSQELISFSSNNTTVCSNNGNPVSSDPNVTGNGICRGAGISYTSSAYYNSSNWTTGGGPSGSDYLEWSVSASAGYLLDLTTLEISYLSEDSVFGSDGPSELQIFADYGSGFTRIYTDNFVPFISAPTRTISLASIPNTVDSVTFRLHAYNSGGTGGEFEIRPINSNKGVIINGSVIDTSCTELFISEYHEAASGDEKYIEIYNPTGAAINLSGYRLVQYNNGSATPTYTLTLSGSIPSYGTYVVANNNSTLCPSGADLCSTSNTMAFNGNDVIALQYAFNNIDVIGTIGSSANFAANVVLRRNANIQFPTTTYNASEWTSSSANDTSNLGSHTSTCQPAIPELQLVDDNNTNQNCGFTIDFGTVGDDGSFNDITFDIENVGTGDLDVSNLNITGDYTLITPPATPFTIAAGNSQTLTVRFTPSGTGTRTGNITITNNDSDEGSCIVDLTGFGFTPGPIADVVITEVMYNTTGTDDEWIEICNVSGSAQVLNLYTIEVDGVAEFTFPPSGVTIANGDCITVSLGDGGGTDYNPDCPFTPDYTNGSGTGTLNNTSDTITLIAYDSTTIDEITYDSSDGGNTTSLHVVDTSLDNSDTSSNYWEVINGGSPGVNSLISPCTPVGPEINVEGNTGNFPDISNMDVTPSTFDGTDFGDLNVGSTLINEFRIENFGGTQDLTITSVTVLSGDTGDFAITSLPASPIAPADPNGFSIFEIQFQPTNDGVRTAVIQIVSNDGDENPYTFTVTGNGLCVASSITASPDSGPEGTIVTVTGTNLASATASFNGVTAVVNNISATEMEVSVPSGATTGNLEIIDDLGCPGFTPFTIIDSEISSCEGSGGTIPTDLFISEITDATRGGLTYIELFNGTGSAINIDDYSIEAIYNGDATALATNILDLEDITIANGDTYVIAIGRLTPVDNTNACTSVTGGSGELASSANAQFTSGGINKKTDEHDVIRLMHMGVVVDEFGVYQDSDWMDSTIITGDRGFNFRRSNTATVLPDPTFTLAELGNWEVIDWVGSGTSSCNTNDYSNIGLFDFSTGTAPIVNSISSSTTSCNEATISVSASEGSSGGNALEYYWFAYDPSNAGLGWQAISNGGIYTTSAASPNLIITDAESVSDFQFYCQVREDDATCYTASNATSITISQATWDGMNWVWNDGTATDTLPAISTNVVLAANFSTANAGLQQSFSACNLTLNDNVTLTINNGHYVEVENNLDVNNTTSGGINIEPEGSFVQINDSGDVNADISTNLTVSKLTAPSNNWYEYTYWSSPVFEETPANGLAASNPNRRFQYNAQYYRDSTFENNNDDTTSTGAGIDDVDDQAPYDWGTISTTYLVPGVGYASTHDPIVFGSTPNCPGPACRIRYTFSGLFNNGVITVPLFRNDSEPDDNNWNLIGNPYPSAIDADVFLNTNMGVIDESIPEPNPIVEGAIYLWSQNTAPSNTTNGNENINFSQSDYAIINGTGQTAAQNNGGDSTIPTRHIPSGQAFFIVMDDTATSTQVSPSPVTGEDIQTADVIFNNAMRVTGNNNQFFRTSTPKDKVWINLTTDNGAFSQILVGYLENATNDYDGMYFDAPKNGSVDSNTAIYTRIDGIEKGFAIQGKSLSSLSIDEIIPLGFNTSISEPTIYTFSIPQVEGPFMNQNDIFVVDKLLNTIHNLKQSDYAFTSDLGTFEDRFDIVFRADALSIDDSILDVNELIITELSEKEVQIKVGANHTISNVEILDVLGRIIYSFNGNSSIEVYDISNLSKAAYIAKVTLTSGQTISKKAIKRL